MRYSLVRQHSEEDCSAVCLATAAKHYERTFALSRVREAVGIGARSTTLLSLSRKVDRLGFHARQVRASDMKYKKECNELFVGANGCSPLQSSFCSKHLAI